MPDVASEQSPLRIAIVGSGPAGFYAAVALFKQGGRDVAVDMFERLPTPYGLVRGGVAPDHQKIKSVTRVYEKCARESGFSFYGNVELGRDIQVQDLRDHYHQIVYAVGNESDRRMGIPGEDLVGCTPATVFVGWYNAHPDYTDARFDFSGKRVAVIGNGNVAVDVARILARSYDELVPTDIADYALEALRDSGIEEILLVGRRGPVQAAYTPAELRELSSLPGAGFLVDPAEVDLDEPSRRQLEAAGSGSGVANSMEILNNAAAEPNPRNRNVRMRFCASPVELCGNDKGRVRRMRLEKNVLVEEAGDVRPRGSGEFEEVEVDWVFVSIGYRGEPLPGVPFDSAQGTIANREGRVIDPGSGAARPGEYAVGWAQSGPRGLIGMHKKASADVVKLMFEDLESGVIGQRPELEDRSVAALLDSRGVPYATFADWERLNAQEVERGKPRGAPRVKFSDVAEMLEAMEIDHHRRRS